MSSTNNVCQHVLQLCGIQNDAPIAVTRVFLQYLPWSQDVSMHCENFANHGSKHTTSRCLTNCASFGVLYHAPPFRTEAHCC